MAKEGLGKQPIRPDDCRELRLAGLGTLLGMRGHD